MAETIGEAYVQIKPSTQGIADDLTKALNGEMDGAGKSAGNKLGGAIKAGLKTAGVAVAAAGTAVTGFAKSAVSAGADFDAAMSQVGATMGYSVADINNAYSEAGQNFQKLRDFAQEMGRTTAFSATEAAEALNYMALAGYDADTSIKTLPTVLNLAAAGNMDLARASDMVTDAQTALGLSLDDTFTMVDQMALTASKSNTSVEQLGDAFLKVGATARNVKGGTNEMATVLGVLADNGIKGTEAGTHLRNILLAMNPTTDKAVAAWSALEVSAYDAQGSLRPLPDVFKDIADATKEMTQQEKTDLFSSMFNKTDLSSINALVGTFDKLPDRFNELSSAIGQAGGAAEQMAGVQLDNLTGDVTLFKSALEGAKIAVSDQLTPTLREFTRFGTDAISNMTAAFKEGGVEGLFTELGTVLTDLTSMLVDKLPEITQSILGLIQSLLEGLIPLLPEILPQLVSMAVELVKMISEELPNIISGLIEGLSAALPVLLDALPDIITSVVDALVQCLPLLIQGCIQMNTELVAHIPEIMKGIYEALPEIIAQLIYSLFTCLPQLLTGIDDMINGIVDALPEMLETLWEATKASMASLIELIVSNNPEFVNAAAELLTSFKEGWEHIKEVGSNIIEGLWNGINSKVEWLKAKIKGFCKSALKSIQDFFHIGSPSKLMADEVGRWIPAGIAVGIDDNASSVIDSMGGLTSDITEAAGVNMNGTVLSNDSDNESGDLYSLLAKYLPVIAQGGNVTIEGDMGKLFTALRKENSQYQNQHNGRSAFA